jgi:hypothetical protein
MNPRDPIQDRRRRRLLYGLAVLFYAPLALSFYLYYGSGGRTSQADAGTCVAARRYRCR